MPDQFKYAYRVQAITLGAGLTDFEIAMQGEKVVYASPTNGPEITVRLQAKSNDAIPLRPQGEIVAPFTRLYISGPSSLLTVYLLIAGPKDIQLTGRDVAISGDVNSILTRDYESYITSIGQGFESGTSLTSAAAVPGHQLKNPVGSGKTVELLYFDFDSAVTAVYLYGRQDANLALTRNGRSRIVGQANSVAENRAVNGAAAGLGDEFGRVEIYANSSRRNFVHIKLGAGMGFQIMPLAAITGATTCRFVWREL